jgi:hypothetical protein
MRYEDLLLKSAPKWPYKVNYAKVTEVSCDVLVLGGGISGGLGCDRRRQGRCQSGAGGKRGHHNQRQRRRTNHRRAGGSGHRLLGFVPGKRRSALPSLAVGNTVRLELSPYDLSIGRIVAELKTETETKAI